MGFCAEFGPRITEDCDHLMVAGVGACSCPACGAVCEGQFDGCSGVWIGPPTATPPPAREPDFAPVADAVEGWDRGDVQDDVLRVLNGSLSELTQEFRSVVATVTQQGEETRALLQAQTNATGMLLEAIQLLPRQLEAVAEGRAIEAGVDEPGDEPRIAEPIEILRPEVVRFDQDPEPPSAETWSATRSRWSRG